MGEYVVKCYKCAGKPGNRCSICFGRGYVKSRPKPTKFDLAVAKYAVQQGKVGIIDGGDGEDISEPRSAFSPDIDGDRI